MCYLCFKCNNEELFLKRSLLCSFLLCGIHEWMRNVSNLSVCVHVHTCPVSVILSPIYNVIVIGLKFCV